MPIPDFQTLMLPVLQVGADGKEHSVRDAIELLAAQFQLTDAEKAELLPSGTAARFGNRVAWAKSYLQQAGLLTTPHRGRFQISDRGQDVLKQKPAGINIKFLKQFPEFLEFQTKGKKETVTVEADSATDSQTPEEMLEAAYQSIRADLAANLLARVKTMSSQFFERLVVGLLVNMGYGGSRKEAGEAIGQSGDEGIDGIVNEDRLGLDTIYLQAKRWEGTVGRPEIQKFVGALQGKRAKKGVFITTGTFSSEAQGYVSHIDPKVVLINGQQLAELMIDFNLGVTPNQSYEVKRIDSDFFDEE